MTQDKMNKWGCRKVSPELIRKVYELYEEPKRAVYYVAELAYTESMQEMAHGNYVHPGGRMTEPVTSELIESELDEIRNCLEDNKAIALSEVKCPEDAFELSYKNITTLFIKSEKGIIGCGWKSPNDMLHTAKYMCSFILYMLSNNSNDTTFIKSAKIYVSKHHGDSILKEFESLIQKKRRN